MSSVSKCGFSWRADIKRILIKRTRAYACYWVTIFSGDVCSWLYIPCSSYSSLPSVIGMKIVSSPFWSRNHWYVGMTFGNKRKSRRHSHAKGLLIHRSRWCVRSVSEGTLPNFPKSKREEGEEYFQICKILVMKPYNKDRTNMHRCASCLGYLKRVTDHSTVSLDLFWPLTSNILYYAY